MNNIGKNIEIVPYFSKDQVVIERARDDYRKVLQLVSLFLGEQEANESIVQLLGAFHHARWMGNAIYFLKICIFRN